MAVATQTLDEANKGGLSYLAVFRGITGWALWDEIGRLVFWPDEAGIESQAYRESLAEVGGVWDEWVFEVDVVARQDGWVLVIEL